MHRFRQSEVGGGNGAQRSPLPGIQAQRPSPSHRTHDTTDQWREIVRRLGRSEAYFPSLLGCHENTSRVPSESLASFRSFQQGFIMVFLWTSLWTSCPQVHFNKELQWFRGGHGFLSSNESSFQQGITMVSWWTWILQFKCIFILARNYNGFVVDMYSLYRVHIRLRACVSINQPTNQ